ncbi:MAG: hypothetical protein K9K64_07405 [Desulfohalobiaceae bacterium]|nr:hypothetical protein [Desulfohalobiaceae bacterium]
MDEEVVVIDVTNLEDCRDKKNYDTLRWIFEDARNQIDQGREILLHQTFLDSPPEMVERIKTRERLDEVAGYYLSGTEEG